MKINLVWDPSAAGAPTGFQTAVSAAADYLDNLIANPITVNIKVGYGEDNGQSIGNALASGGPFIYGQGLTYAQIRAELALTADSVADASAIAHLPATDPTNGGAFYVAAAQEKAWGLRPADGAEIDGSVGFSGTTKWDYNPDDRAVAGEYDLVGAAEHELTHAMGRTYGLGELFGPSDYTVLDLFRYASPGIPELTGGQPAYFSIDGGTTDLNAFDMFSDFGDWASSVGPDSFGYATLGVEGPVTQTDITAMNVIGFAVTPCFRRGTRVLTAEGERAVEHLAVGERVLTAGGRAAPIVWIGERGIDCRCHPAREKVWPVRIRAGAFAEGKPVRDLLLSPDHAVFCDGVLIPAKHLVNGATIVQEAAAHVYYFHIELDRHDILVAHGLEVESYLDTGNRGQFGSTAGCQARWRVAPDRAHGCAPFRTAGAEVVAIRRRLLARAHWLGWRGQAEFGAARAHRGRRGACLRSSKSQAAPRFLTAKRHARSAHPLHERRASVVRSGIGGLAQARREHRRDLARRRPNSAVQL